MRIHIVSAAVLLMAGCSDQPMQTESARDAGLSDIAPDIPAEEPFDPAMCLRDPTCNRAMVVAHRGLHSAHPENSLASIRGAAAVGVEMVEIDVRHTSDLQLVLMHDAELDRTTNGTGKVSEMSFTAVRQLRLTGGDPNDPEDVMIPTLDEALDVAEETGVMIYLDQKTDRWDLVMDVLESRNNPDLVLVRDDVEFLVQMVARNDQLLYMAPVKSPNHLDAVAQAVPTIPILEIGSPQADPVLSQAIRDRGFHVQHDVIFGGDVLAHLNGDYSGWASFVEAGVLVLQTDLPEILVPAMETYRQTGVFPTGPGQNP